MGILQEVLDYKRQQEAQRLADIGQISTAVQLFQQARQQAIQNNIAQMQVKAGLAGRGLKIGTDGNIVRDPSLEEPPSPLDELITKGKAAEAARTLGDRDLFNSIVGGKDELTPSVNYPVSPEQGDGTQYVNEIDPFTQKPTVRAEQAKLHLEQKKKDADPLSGESAMRYAGAKQGVDNINSIIKQINDFSGDKRGLIKEANLAIEAENAKDIPLAVGMKGAYKVFKLSRVSNDGKALANNFSTLAENLLRARTGATAPEPEIVREYARTLLKTFQENPSTWNQKLKNNFDFLKSVHDEIRPLRKDEATLNGEIANFDEADSEGNVLNRGVGYIANHPFKSLTQPLTKTVGGKSLGEMYDEGAAIKPFLSSGDKGASKAKAFVQSYLGGLGADVADIAQTPATILGGLAGRAWRAADTLRKTAPIVEKQAVQAQSILTKIKGDEIINDAVRNARTNLMGKGGYVYKEHKLYSSALDKIKGSDELVKGPDELLRNFALKHRDETTLKFPTAEIQNAHDMLYQKFSATGKITQDDLVTAIKSIKGKFKGKVDSEKSLNLRAASDLVRGLSSKSSRTLKAADARYAQFKSNEKNIDDLLGLYGKAKKTDSVVSGLLTKDLGIEQSKVAQLIGEKTGIKLLDTINYYRGINQVRDAFWLTRQINSFASGAEKIIKSRPGRVSYK